jgi:hypothetical protein
VALGNVTSLRTLLIAVAFTLAWYLPSLIGSMVHLTVEKDLVKDPENKSFVSVIVSSLAAGILGSFAVVISVILTDSLVINRQSDPALRWPLAIVVGLVITLKFLLEHFLQAKREDGATHPQKLYLARVVSPGMAMTLLGSLFAVVYIWTQSYVAAAGAALVIAAPYFLLFLVFPRIAVPRLANGKRNMNAEALFIGLLTFAIYTAISFLPTTVIAKSQAFILLGLVPGLLHGIYSVVVASSEHVARKAEEVLA